MKGLPANPAAPVFATIALAAALLAPAAVFARSSDRNQPMDIDAGSGEMSLDDSKPTTLSGGVTITQGTLNIQSSTAVITRSNGEPTRVVLNGSPVRLKQQMDDGSQMNASAAKVDYDLTTEMVVFIGNASIQQPRGSLSGGRVVYNMKTNQVQANDGGDAKGGRVKMRILPKGAPPASGSGG